MKQMVTIRKVPVSFLIDILLEVESAGVQFVDIQVKHGEKFDKMTIVALEDVTFPSGEVNIKFNGKNANDLIV